MLITGDVLGRDLPLADYSVIGDMRTAVLVSRFGSMDWACFPRFDSPSVFGRILDRDAGGYFQIAPVAFNNSSQRYEEGTNVVATAFHLDDGMLELIDFMPLEASGRNTDYLEVHRRIEARGCDVEVEITFHPAFDYGRRGPARLRQRKYGVLATDRSNHSIALSVDHAVEWELDKESGVIRGRLTVPRGHRVWFVARFDDDEVWPTEEYRSRDRLHATRSYWLDWISDLRYEGEYRSMVERSALVLKLLVYQPTGAIVAAPTTSLPEEMGGVRNWDYRFSWLRDSTFTLFSLYALGKFDELDRYMDYLKRVCRRESDFLQIMYGVGGELRLDEMELDHWKGYGDSRPVRIGNGAVDQIQMDVYGEVMDSIHIWRRYHPMTEGMWDLVEMLANWVADNWRRKDNGVWEVRNEPRHFVFSKVMCWVALDRAVRAAEDSEEYAGPVDRWREERDALYADIMENGWDEERGAFVQSYGSKDLDAANLVLPLVRFIPADDPRMVSTVDRIREELADPETGLLYRYHSADGLEGGEGTFLVNTFQLAQVLALQGRVKEATEVFESVLRRSTPTGLLSEEYDAATGELLGNFPQGYSHIGLINAAHVISRMRRNVEPSEPMLPDQPGG